MFLVKKCVLLILIIFATTYILAQKAENLKKWLKIKPLISTREDVEKLHGKGRKGLHNQHVVMYETPEGILQIEYSLGDCESSQYSGWNVPEWTVIEASYSLWKKPLKLKGLILDESEYKREQSGDVPDHYKFSNEEKGVSIFYDDELKEVRLIDILPSSKDKLKYDCNLIKNRKKG